MIENFEEETFTLTDEEVRIANQLSQYINRDANKHSPWKLDEFIYVLKKAYPDMGFSRARVGKMIAYIRQQGLVIGLCSTNKGYFVYKTIEDLESTVRSLGDRLKSQIATYKAMQSQLNSLKKENK